MNPNFCSVIKASSLKLFAAAVVLFIASIGSAQADSVINAKTTFAEKPSARPFRVLTAGKHITVQCKKDISKIMVWTGTGHRIVEENGLNSSSYSFNITIGERFFYIMLELKDGKRYTEKIGVQ
ncbi:MAG: hypothetical protein JWM28_2906 [Chitinophagaceae bacterium]|nr:hypothetical protein [Chitinophagaceae bacterium]